MGVIQSVLSISDYGFICNHQVNFVPNISIISFTILITYRILWKVYFNLPSLFYYYKDPVTNLNIKFSVA